MGVFKIDADQFQWITGPEDDPNDLCLHGHVMVQVGNHSFDDMGTVSATALYLLKSLTEDKIMSKYDIQMIPCCGHFLIANEDLSKVTICGCDNGTDWSIIHSDGGIKIVLPSGAEEQVEFSDYKAEVFRFADKIEAYYKSCQPKIMLRTSFPEMVMWHFGMNGIGVETNRKNRQLIPFGTKGALLYMVCDHV